MHGAPSSLWNVAYAVPDLLSEKMHAINPLDLVAL